MNKILKNIAIFSFDCVYKVKKQKKKRVERRFLNSIILSFILKTYKIK